jgi:hypothetical protein
VVAFDIEPRSIAWGSNPCDSSEPLGVQHYKKGEKITHTFTMTFIPSDLTWAHRLDHYTKTANDQNIHVLNFVLSVLIVIVLLVLG